jgi:hypothetical protein
VWLSRDNDRRKCERRGNHLSSIVTDGIGRNRRYDLVTVEDSVHRLGTGDRKTDDKQLDLY